LRSKATCPPHRTTHRTRNQNSSNTSPAFKASSPFATPLLACWARQKVQEHDLNGRRWDELGLVGQTTWSLRMWRAVVIYLLTVLDSLSHIAAAPRPLAHPARAAPLATSCSTLLCQVLDRQVRCTAGLRCRPEAILAPRRSRQQACTYPRPRLDLRLGMMSCYPQTKMAVGAVSCSRLLIAK